jgi:hypothetical protein
MTAPGRHGRPFVLVACLVPTVLAATALVGAWTVLGHRQQAAPVPGQYGVVVAEAGGLRLHDVRAHVDERTRGGWTRCGAGRYEHTVRRDGSRAELDLVFHPDPELGDCGPGDHVHYGPGGGSTPGLFVPLDGPPPTVVTAAGRSEEHRVVDPLLGADVALAGWRTSSTAVSYARPGVAVQQWEAGDRRSLRLSHPVRHVGDPRTAWVRADDLGPGDDYFTGAPRVLPDLGLRLAGVRVTARFRAWDVADAAYVRLTSLDGRAVLELETVRVGLQDLRQLVRSLRVRP